MLISYLLSLFIKLLSTCDLDHSVTHFLGQYWILKSCQSSELSGSRVIGSGGNKQFYRHLAVALNIDFGFYQTLTFSKDEYITDFVLLAKSTDACFFDLY